MPGAAEEPHQQAAWRVPLVALRPVRSRVPCPVRAEAARPDVLAGPHRGHPERPALHRPQVECPTMRAAPLRAEAWRRAAFLAVCLREAAEACLGVLYLVQAQCSAQGAALRQAAMRRQEVWEAAARLAQAVVWPQAGAVPRQAEVQAVASPQVVSAPQAASVQAVV